MPPQSGIYTPQMVLNGQDWRAWGGAWEVLELLQRLHPKSCTARLEGKNDPTC